MPCYRPLDAYRTTKKGKTGKIQITFKRSESAGIALQLPCGRCIGCRLDKSREWAIRMVHEASLHEENCFLTLTYRDADLPGDLSLDKDHFQKFMKRMRKHYAPKRIRFFHCGEYGNSPYETLGRPHYHAIIFGHDFQDKELFSNREGNKLYTSRELDLLWKKGFATVGAVTWQSAAYVARYVTKKMTGDKGDYHYYKASPVTGELFPVEPEYATMSRRPGIGRDWYEKYSTDLFPHDHVVHDGKELKIPRYYESIYEVENPDEFERIRKERRKKGRAKVRDNTPERLAVREFCKHKQVERLTRGYENETLPV